MNVRLTKEQKIRVANSDDTLRQGGELLGITVLDHLIISEDAYLRFHARGWIKLGIG